MPRCRCYPETADPPGPSRGQGRMQRILILFSHPAFEPSRVHRRPAEAADGLPGAGSPRIEAPVDDLLRRIRPAVGNDAAGSEP